MKKKTIAAMWSWIALGLIANWLLWAGWAAWGWYRDVETRLDSAETRLDGAESRLLQLEQAVVSKHPELGQAPASMQE